MRIPAGAVDEPEGGNARQVLPADRDGHGRLAQPRGVDLTLTTYHACRIDSGEIVLTVSQPYPVRDMAHFEAAPKTEGASAGVNSYPESIGPDEMTVFAEVVANNPMALAITNHLKK